MLRYDRKKIKGWAKSKIPIIWSKRYTIIAVLILLVLLYLFRSFIAMVVVMATFILVGVVSMMYNRWIKISVGVELIMLGMVITAVVYGSIPGMIVGFAALFFAEVITDRFTYSTFVSFIGIFAVTIVTPRLDFSITWIGILMTLLYDVIIAPGYLLMGSSPWRTALFVVTHIIFNIWAFIFIAPFVLRLLT